MPQLPQRSESLRPEGLAERYREVGPKEGSGRFFMKQKSFSFGRKPCRVTPTGNIGKPPFPLLRCVLSRQWRNFLLNMKNYIIGIVLLLVAGFLMLDPLQWQPRAVPVDQVPNEPVGFADANRSTEPRSSFDPLQPTPNARTRPMAMPPLPFPWQPQSP